MGHLFQWKNVVIFTTNSYMSIGQLHSIFQDSIALLTLSKQGINYSLFQEIVNSSSFSLKEWSKFLHITERTLQRYKKEQKTFEMIHSERIIEIAKLQNRGTEIFGSRDNFDQWMNSKIIALGGIMPVELLDSAFGIDILMDELGRIEHGVLA